MKIIIDCDPGHDDAAAILYAAAHLELIGLTTVYGNQDVTKTTRNALKICELGGLETPVAEGAARPWIVEARPIPETHGETGLDGMELPEPTREPLKQSAVDFIIEHAHRFQGELVIAAIAPLTNVATAIRVEPKLRKWLKAITIMGGSTSYGNVTPNAEFNIHSDPEAAHAVFNSGINLYMCGLNVTRQVGVGRKDISRLHENGKKVSTTFAALFTFYRTQLERVFGIDTASLHDPCSLMPFIDDSLISFREVHVDIELSPGLTRGMTVCDMRYMGPVGGRVVGGSGIKTGETPNVKVATEVKHSDAVKSVLETLNRYP